MNITCNSPILHGDGQNIQLLAILGTVLFYSKKDLKMFGLLLFFFIGINVSICVLHPPIKEIDVAGLGDVAR